MSLRLFAGQAAAGINAGLQQELNILQGYHYRVEVDNASRVVVVRLRHINPHYLSKINGMQNQLTMWAGMDEDHKVRIGWQGRTILIEVPKPGKYWQKITIEQLEQYHYIRQGAVATIGLGLQDDPKRIDFRLPDMAHLFIVGQTRSGKTNLQRLIGWNLASHSPDTNMIIFDVAKRGYNWSDFSNVANLAHPVITELAEADRVLAWASQEIERRAEKWRNVPIGQRHIRKTFLLIDELKALIADSQVAADYLNRLASVGGEFGLHLILSTQYPQSSILGTGSAELNRNVTTRLCGKVNDANAAVNALGIAGSGAETLQGYGDFLLKDGDGLSRLTVAKIEPAHVAKLPRTDMIPSLPLPDDDQVNGGPPAPARNEPMCVEPEHAALALIEPAGIGKFRDRIIELGLAETFSKARAKRTLEYAEAQRRFIQNNSPEQCAFDFLGGNWIELEPNVRSSVRPSGPKPVRPARYSPKNGYFTPDGRTDKE